jgi:hypothetical protein
MATPISFRPNDEDVKNLALLEAAGMSPTEAIRTALAAAAVRLRQREQLTAEADRLRRDTEDAAEVRRVRQFMGDMFDGLAE